MGATKARQARRLAQEAHEATLQAQIEVKQATPSAVIPQVLEQQQVKEPKKKRLSRKRRKKLRASEQADAGPAQAGTSESAENVAATTVGKTKIVETIVEAASFEELALVPKLCHATAELGWEQPTNIQARCIGLILAGKDVLACSPTGSGKTGAFLLPLLQRVLQKKGVLPSPGTQSTPQPLKQIALTRALILTPTRELANQCNETIIELTRFVNHDGDKEKTPALTSVTVYGGASEKPQLAALKRKVDIVVACPGRLLELCHKHPKSVCLKAVSTVVLDEADKMVEFGFQAAVQEVMSLIPKRGKGHCQTLLFAATLYRLGPLRNLVKSGEVVEVLAHSKSKPALPPSITQVAYECPDSWESKQQLLLELLVRGGARAHRGQEKPQDKESEMTLTLVFVETKEKADHLSAFLGRSGIACSRIHSDRSQGQRNTALQALKDETVRVLVSTNVLSRGIDVPRVSHVLNLDVPKNAHDFVHRIGRTARACRAGTAITLFCKKETLQLDQVEALVGALPRAPLPSGFVFGPGPVPGSGTRKQRRKEKRQRELQERAGRSAVNTDNAARTEEAPAPQTVGEENEEDEQARRKMRKVLRKAQGKLKGTKKRRKGR